MECIYRVKFIEKKQDSLLFEMQSNHSENPLCKSSKKFFKVFKKDLKSSLKSIKPGTLVFLKEWTYSAMGAKGVVNALEYTVLESIPK
ncbi:MAG: hypothetical protein VX642_04745 [Bdellovibrionota bacterium]|nr:hypothetical protein [Bdellovibrionota bacterium]